MELEMVLNELSLKNPVSDIPAARKLMSELISTLRQAKISGVKILRTSNKIDYLELAPNYPIARWRNDQEVDKEEIRFFKTLVTKAPFWTDEFQEFKDVFDLSEIRYEGEIVNSIGFALIIDGLPVSFNYEKRWNNSYLSLEVLRIYNSQQIVSETVEIVHASCRNHVKEHNNWIQNRFRTEILDGEQLWNQTEELFHNLEFCDEVYKQISCLDNGKPIFRQVIKKLFELQESSKNWTDGAFKLETLASKASVESQSRIRLFESELTFKCSDDEKRLFSLHVRITPGAWRLHFCTELGPGKIIIGYIGCKIQ